MKFTTKLQLGNREIIIEDEARSVHEFWQKQAFWDSIPKVGPGNAVDVELRFRTTEEGYEYYSLYCPSQQKEFRFGQKQDRDKTLFPKWKEGWQQRQSGNAETGSTVTANDVRDLMHRLGVKDRASALSTAEEIIGKALLPAECSQQELDKLHRELAQRLSGR